MLLQALKKIQTCYLNLFVTGRDKLREYDKPTDAKLYFFMWKNTPLKRENGSQQWDGSLREINRNNLLEKEVDIEDPLHSHHYGNNLNEKSKLQQ